MRALLILLAVFIAQAAHAAAVVGSGGFAVTSCSPTCTSVCADWYIPEMTTGTSGGDATLSIWPGIGSLNGVRIAQAGTLLTMLSSNGAVSFNTFWEQFPAAENIDNSAGTPRPFDHMHGCTTCATNCTANNAGTTWNFTVQDVTQGWTYTNNGSTGQSCLCDAEVFVEPQGNSQNYADLPNFGVIPLFNITVNGSAVSMSGTTFDYFWQSRVYPSAPGPDGQSGNVCHGDGGAYAAAKCTTPPWAFSTGRGAGF